MFSLNLLSAVISYALESSIESLIIFLIIMAVMWMKGLNSPAARSRFLLLPLIIPAVFSPALHVVVPRLEHFAIIVQMERALPILGKIRSHEALVAPFLVAAFLLLLAHGLLTGVAAFLREVRSSSQTKVFARVPGQETLNCLARQLGVSRSLMMISTRQPRAVYVYGWKHAIVTLGSECIAALDPEELNAVLAHELAHFKCGDNWQVLIARTCRDLMFFNPLAHVIHEEYEEAREQAADDLALKITQKPLALASSLLKYWQVQKAVAMPLGGVAFATDPRQLEKRIRRLCNYSQMARATQPNNGFFYGLAIALSLVLSIV